MKRFFYFCIVFFVLLFMACTGFELQSKFVSVLGSDARSVSLEKSEQLNDNSVLLCFSDVVEIENLKVEDEKTELLYSLTEDLADGKSTKLIKILDKIQIAQEFKISGSVKSGRSKQDFELVFIGKNINPAKLALREYKPYGKTKTVKIPEFIELEVLESGNVSEMKLCSVGSSKNLDYTFPACEVKKGECIVVHLNPGDEENAHENFTDELGAEIYSDIKTARDLYSNLGRAKRRKSNIVLLENPDGLIVDYFFYVHSKNIHENEIQWDSDIQKYVKKLQESAFAKDFEAKTKNPETYNLTSTVSYAKLHGSWAPTKKITRGEKNE